MVNQKCSATIISVVIASLVIFTSLAFMTKAYADDCIIVGNKNVPVESISRDDIKSIFLGEKTKWDNNMPIVFVTLKTGDAHEAFLKSNVGKSTSQFASYWKKMVFTGKGRAPKSFKTADMLVEYVSVTEGAIGYIPSGVIHDTTKTLSIQ